MKVAVTTSSFAEFSDEPLRLLRERGIDCILNPHGRALTEEEAKAFLHGCAGVAAGTEPLTAAVMEAVPGLRVISRCGTGMDNVDLKAAEIRGILVRNTPDGPTLAVAELTLGYALDLMRGITRMDREVRAGVWKKRMGNLLLGKKAGLIGYGRIGRAVAGYFERMGCETAFFDPMITRDETEGRTRMELSALLAWADVISLHASKPGDGRAILDAVAMDAMKDGAFIINSARGGLVDEDALASALRTGRLAGAALDVFGKEPYDGPLRELDGVILTPHIGSYAKEARIRMETDTVRNLLDALDSLSA